MADMELILRADVENLGRLGEIVVVKPGFGRNFLIPKGLAMLATESNKKVFEYEKKKLQSKMDAVKGEAEALASKVRGVVTTLAVRVGEGDKLYGAVTRAMIAEAVGKLGVEIDRKKIQLAEPIRTLGEYELELKLHPDVECLFTVKVVNKNAPLVQAAAEADAALAAQNAPTAEAPAEA